MSSSHKYTHTHTCLDTYSTMVLDLGVSHLCCPAVLGLPSPLFFVILGKNDCAYMSILDSTLCDKGNRNGNINI